MTEQERKKLEELNMKATPVLGLFKPTAETPRTEEADAELANNLDKLDAAITADRAAIAGKAEAAAVAALAANLGTTGHNCRIATGSYTGNGVDYFRRITFELYPLVVLIAPVTTNDVGYPAVFIRLNHSYSLPGGYQGSVTWGEDWMELRGKQNAYAGLNGPMQYYYVVLGHEKETEEA